MKLTKQIRAVNNSTLIRLVFFAIGIVVFYLGFRGINERFDPINKPIESSIRLESWQSLSELFNIALEQEEIKAICSKVFKSYDSFHANLKNEALILFTHLKCIDVNIERKVVTDLKSENSDLLTTSSLNYLILRPVENLADLLVELLKVRSEYTRLVTLNFIKKTCQKNLLEFLKKYEETESNLKLQKLNLKVIQQLSTCSSFTE